MHVIVRSVTVRMTVLGVSMVAIASPLTAQFTGSTRTFETSVGCGIGILGYDWPAGTEFPRGRTVGTAFCTRARVTIGQDAFSSASWLAQVRLLDLDIPAGNNPVNPDSDQPWLQIFGGTTAPSWVLSTSGPYTDRPLTSIVGSIDIFTFRSRDTGLYDFTPTSFALSAEWRVKGHPNEFTGICCSIVSERADARIALALVETTVPEPSAWALMGTGLLAIGGVAVRRKRAA
jgi:hypothetical protein